MNHSDNDNIKRFPSQRPPGGDGPRDSEFGERIVRLEEKIVAMKDRIDNDLATKKNISDLKVWILGGVLSSIAVAATIATLIVKAFFSD